MSEADSGMRTFKTAWLAQAARKAGIADRELCAAIREVVKGQADDRGGVYKKRLNRNQHRSIVLTKVGSYWLYQTCSPRRIAPTSMTMS